MDPNPSSNNDQPQQAPPVTPTPAEPIVPVQESPASPEQPQSPFTSTQPQPDVQPQVSQPPQPEASPVVQPPVAQQPQSFIGAQPMTPPSPNPKKKGLMIGLIAAGAAALLIGIGIFVWLTFFVVSKADYQAAADKYTTISKTLEETTGDSSTSESASAKIDTFATQTKEMGDLKAVRNDQDIKSAYDKMYALVPGYVSKVHAAADFAKIGDDACDSANLDTRSGAQACSVALGSFDAKGWTALQKLNDTLKDYLDESLKGTSPSSTEYRNASADFADEAERLNDDMKSAATAFRDAIDKKLTK